MWYWIIRRAVRVFLLVSLVVCAACSDDQDVALSQTGGGSSASASATNSGHTQSSDAATSGTGSDSAAAESDADSDNAAGAGSTPTGDSGNDDTAQGSSGEDPSTVDLTCDNAPYPSAQWTTCESRNYAKVLEAPTEQASNPEFLARFSAQSTTNFTDFVARDAADPSWLLATSPALSNLLSTNPTAVDQSLQDRIAAIQNDPENALDVPLNTPLTPLCATWSLPCTGDPFRYPEVNGADGDAFYTDQAKVAPVVFYDSQCARLSGRVWRPRDAAAGANLPGIVIDNGSVQAPETLYWWAAQMLVRNGYAVMTFDPRGQGRSDMQTPGGTQGSNANVSVFWTGLVDAIDFFHSTPVAPYPNNTRCAGTYPTQVTAYNPFNAVIDPDRLGLAGHSAGAEGVSVVQGYGAPGAAPWPGQIDEHNPVTAIVAWDGLVTPDGKGLGGASGPLPGDSGATGDLPDFGIRRPALDMDSEYGLAPAPYRQPPDPNAHKAAYREWKAADVPVYTITIRGASHYEWSLLPTFPATSWCPKIADNACTGGWGNAMARHYTLAWFDRWLKQPGEQGYQSADARLLDDNGPQGRVKMSWHFHSARHFTAREGTLEECGNIRSGCGAAAE